MAHNNGTTADPSLLTYEPVNLCSDLVPDAGIRLHDSGDVFLQPFIEPRLQAPHEALGDVRLRVTARLPQVQTQQLHNHTGTHTR